MVLREAENTAQPVPQDSAHRREQGQETARAGGGDKDGQAREVGAYYVQWCRGDEIERRIADGWTVAQHQPCHHNEYALLMRAPEGWTP